MTRSVEMVRRADRWRAWAGLLPVLVVVLVVTVTAVNLTRPDRIMFDEVYYVNDARDVLEHGVEQRFLVHPPLAVRLIAASIALLGDHPLGWRAPAALAGALTVLLTYLLVRRLTGVPLAAGFAALLLVVDGAFLVQSRIAMLDIFATAFVVLGAWLAVVDRQRRTAPRIDGCAGAGAGVPWALLGAGAALGLAVAAKWSGVLALATVASLVAMWEVGHLRRLRPARRRVARACWWFAATMIVVPAAVYLLTWVPWVANVGNTDTGRELCAEMEDDPSCLSGPDGRVRALVEHHRRILEFHSGFSSQHRYQSPPIAWVLQTRPVTYLWDPCDGDGRDRDGARCAPAGHAAQIFSLGNLAVWWTGLLALPVLAAAAVRRELRAVVPLALVLGQFLPWLAVGRPGFSYYAVPLVPFLAAGIAVATLELGRDRSWRGLLLGTAAGGLVGLAAALVVASRSAADLVTTSWIIGAVGLVGAALGGRHDVVARGEAQRDDPAMDDPATDDHAALTRRVLVLGGVVALVAIGVFLYFAPLWLGIPMELDAVRARWWFDSWV